MALTNNPDLHWATDLGRFLGASGFSLRDADAETEPSRDSTIKGVRNVHKSMPMVNGAVHATKDAVIGNGLQLVADPVHQALGQSAAWAQETSELFQWRFGLWADSREYAIDAHRKTNRAGLERIALQQLIMDGEILAVAGMDTGRGDYGTNVLMVDPDRLGTPPDAIIERALIQQSNTSPTKRIKRGLEIDDRRGWTHAWIANRHPGFEYQDNGSIMRGRVEWVRMRRFGPNGRTRIIHWHDQERADQTRGISRLAHALKKSEQLACVEDSVLENAIANAMYAAVITSSADHITAMAAIGAESGGDKSLKSALEAKAAYHAGAGVSVGNVKIPHLLPGEQLELLRTELPLGGLEEFERVFLRHIAADLNLNYELLAGDYSQTNFAAAKSAMMDVWRTFSVRRKQIGDHFSSVLYELFLEEEFARGYYVPPASAPGFYEAKAAWTHCRWIGPGKGQLEPSREADAIERLLKLGIGSLQTFNADVFGLDWRSELRQRKAELDFIESLGLPLPEWATGGDALSGAIVRPEPETPPDDGDPQEME